MNTRKKSKRHKAKAPKKGIKTKTKDGQAEVFVLPPDLLQKLGIDLGSFGSSIVCPTYTTNKTDDHLNGAPVNSNNGKVSENTTCNTQKMETKRDSTILETADLMKKSVFLSPTFVTADSIDPGELEISNGLELKETEEGTQNYTNTMPTEVVVGTFTEIDNVIATVHTQGNAKQNSSKQSTANPNNDKIVIYKNTTVGETNQESDESLPRIEKLSVIVNHQGNTTEIINKSSQTLNPDSDKEISSEPDSTLISIYKKEDSEMTADSYKTEYISDNYEIQETSQRDNTKTILAQVAENDNFPEIDNNMSVIVNTKKTTEICNEKSTLNLDSDIDISNSSDCNYILRPALDVLQTKVGKDERASSTDDHSDEAYMSDCSNRTLSPTDSTGSVLNIPEIKSYVSTECQNKINIISEEILSPSKLKNLQIMLSPKKSRFIPVSINCILEKSKLREKYKNTANTIENLTNTRVSPVFNGSVISNEDQNKDLDLLELYDAKGNNISVLKNSSNFDIITDVKIEDLSQNAEQDTASEMQTPENHTFGDIDLVVIGMDIEENEHILENFVHEITSNDDTNILKKIEQSEKYCSPVKLDSGPIVPKILTNTLTENKLVEIEDQRNINLINTDELISLADLNITEYSSNDFNKSMTTDKILQVLEMSANCNNNVIQSGLGIKNNELGEINKALGFERDYLKSKAVNTHTVKKATEASSNDNMIDNTDLEYIELNVIPFTSNDVKERNQNVDGTCHNECIEKIYENVNGTRNNDFIEEKNENVDCTRNNEFIEDKNENVDGTRNNEFIEDKNENVDGTRNNEFIEDKNENVDGTRNNEFIEDKNENVNGTRNNDFIEEKNENVDGTRNNEFIEDKNENVDDTCNKEFIEKRNENVDRTHNKEFIEDKNENVDGTRNKEFIEDKNENVDGTRYKKNIERRNEDLDGTRNNEFIEDKNENLDGTRNNEFISLSHSDAKPKEKKYENDVKLNENRVICAFNDYSTIVEKKSEEVDTYNSPEQLSKNLNRVQEIAMYLSQFAKNHSEIGKTRRKSVTKMKIPPKRSKNNALTSKIFIQGVEKPGGSQRSDEDSDDFKVHKVEMTYARPKKTQKSITRPLVVTPTKESHSINISINEQENSNNLIQESRKNSEFCLCGDFGRLANYDSEVPYEHIHFWEHKLGLSDRESIFSIYDDEDESNVNVDPKITEISDFLEGQDKSSKTLLDSICWHSCKKVPIPIQNDETVSVTDNTTNAKEVKVLSNLSISSNTDDTIKPTKVCCVDKNTSKAVSELQSENNSDAINRKNECSKMDLNTSKEMSSPHEEKKIDSALPVKDVLCSQETESLQENPKVCKANNHAEGDVKDAKLFKSELKKKIAHKIKSAKSFDSMKNKADDNETLKEAALLKKYSIDVKKQIVASDFRKSLKDRLMFEEGTIGESSQIKANVSTSVDNVKSVDKKIVDLKGDEVDHSTPETENTQEKKKGKKRRKSEKRNEKDDEEPASKKSAQCDVCKTVLSEEQWQNHVASEHCYIAWKSGSTFNFENLRLLKQLQDRIKTDSNLKCTFCSAELVHPKKFIKHVQRCISKLEDSSSLSMEASTSNETVHDISQSNITLQEDATVNAPEPNKSISSADTCVCGVCNENVTTVHWMEHIRQKHDYLAWKVGDIPLNLDNEDNVRIHLLNLARVIGELTCSKCGLARRYPKSFMQHIQQCTGKNVSKLDQTFEDQMSDDDGGEKTLHEIRNENKSAASDDMWECGVCKEKVSENAWLHHIKLKHEYLAWKVGDPPLNLDNEEEVRMHLLNVSRATGGLICSKCGLSRKYPKSYMQHIQQCTGNDESRTDQTGDVVKSVDCIVHELLKINKTESPECAICKEAVAAADWMEHIKRKHDYLAWKTGHPPLNLDNEEEIRTHLFEIVKVTGELTCSKCGLSRKYPKSFMQHIQQCTGKDENLNTSNRTVEIEYVPRNPTDPVKCAVCSKDMLESQWLQHILDEHHYIAWREGDQSLNLDNEEEIRLHLFEIVKVTGELTCSKCGLSRKYPKSFMQHIQQCTGKYESLNTSTRTVEIEYVPRNPTDPVKCAVCSKDMLESQWMQHILDEHHYIAWREGDQPLNLDSDEEIRLHLFEIVKVTGELTCSKCGLSRKYPKSFMQHIQQCTGKDESLNTSNRTVEIEYVPRNPTDPVKCAVCSKNMLESQWLQHILDEHQYIAWREGEQPLNVDDAEAMKAYLYSICKETGCLTCNKCGRSRKYVKVYLQHIESCTGQTTESEVLNESVGVVSVKAETNYLGIVDQDTTVICAVCDKEVSSAKWIQHIGRAHNYMAHYKGQSLDLNDQEVVYSFLYEVVKRVGHLVCSKCGLMRKYAKTFIQHTNTCNVEGTIPYNSDGETQTADGNLVCAVCSKEMQPKKWNQHKMEHHYNVAWTVGSIPVDVKNAYVIDMLLKDYVDKYKKMVCNACGATRASRLGFYAHVIQCGKTEAEIDAQKTTCGVCKKKYLYIYHNQHMAWHTQQEQAAQRKLKQAEEQEQKRVLVKQEQQGAVSEDGTPGRRRAAQKAKNVIENLKKDDFTYNCPNCKFGGDSKEEILNHMCQGIEAKDGDQFSDSGESARVDEYSGGEETEDSIEVDSDVSKEETENVPKRKRKKKCPSYVNIRRYPFVPKNLKLFLKKAGTEFLQQHFVTDTLFPNLRSFDCEPIPSDELSKYLPLLEESCKVQLGTGEWVTYRRFQVDRKECVNAKLNTVSIQCMFTGGYIQCVSWAQPEPGKAFNLNFLAVACHQGSDVIRLQVDEAPAHPGLIQLWSFGDFTQQAELSFGLAHEYGSAWAMDWCPYGARDAFPPPQGAASNVLRLGLLAVAFSSGTVAVFAVPYPACLVKKEKLIQKLKPVVELRQTMNPERQIFQATSVCWSKQKPYDSIVVGYADGTTAYFDLNTESPFLRAVENGVIVLYPYHDERALNKCVTGMDLYPSVDSVGPAGAACFSSGSGVSLLARPGVRPARQFISAAMASAHFEPLWPSAALVGDEGNLASAVNEIEWYGGGRRMGGGCAGAGCVRCGRFVFAATPLLCVRYPHPADNTAKTEVAGVLQMTPLSKKRKKLANDELQTIVEPTTYEDAVTKYGIKIGLDKDILKKVTNMQTRDSYPERFPERFPLGDVTSMAFCPDVPHHKKLAIATHSGMLFLIEI